MKTAALSAALLMIPSLGDAGQRYGSRPKLVLSSDLSAPWMLQLKPQKPRKRGFLTHQVKRQYPRFQRNRINPGRTGVTTASVQREAALRRSASNEINPALLPAIVDYNGEFSPGTVIVNTPERRLYLVMPGGKARRYAVGVGKPGFEWAGTHKVTRKAEWPSWRPPAEMIAREKRKGRDLPTFMEGGPENPLGARALYLGSSIYRIHGTNQAWSIGKAVSSGCIRMRNEDVMDLYERVPVGAKVKVI
ncbi:MAG: L,D-transpeptidase [Rhizobiaceae bacterium]